MAITTANYFTIWLIGLLTAFSDYGHIKPDRFPQNQVIHYDTTTEDFANPERGFYRYSETHVDQYKPLELNHLKEWRTLQPATNGNYRVYSTLVFRYFVMDGYAGKPLPASFLENIKKDCAVVREAGVKLIARFTYTVKSKKGNCLEQFICPPYGDASPEMVVHHIQQLKPIFRQNSDVVACYQAGFIGIWGEQYYSDHFGDPSANGNGKLLDKNWQDRIVVLKTLLEAIPPDRMIQVRMPQTKQKFVYGLQAAPGVAALTNAEAYTGSDKARIGFHNDCFLSGPDDYGTFDDLGSDQSSRNSPTETMRTYMKEDSKYVVVGGETCSDAFSPQSSCETLGIAQTEMRGMHYSFLNCAYNNKLNNQWQEQGCMEDIKKNLGYRFILKKARFPVETRQGNSFPFELTLQNEGYASPFNERPVLLVLRNKEHIYSLPVATDIRTWYSGLLDLKTSVNLPADFPKGTYELLLHMPDKYTTISNRPEYAIRLANKDIWEQNTGYNKLLTHIKVK